MHDDSLFFYIICLCNSNLLTTSRVSACCSGSFYLRSSDHPYLSSALPSSELNMFNSQDDRIVNQTVSFYHLTSQKHLEANYDSAL